MKPWRIELMPKSRKIFILVRPGQRYLLHLGTHLRGFNVVHAQGPSIRTLQDIALAGI